GKAQGRRRRGSRQPSCCRCHGPPSRRLFSRHPGLFPSRRHVLIAHRGEPVIHTSTPGTGVSSPPGIQQGGSARGRSVQSALHLEQPHHCNCAQGPPARVH